ncbi:MAG: hypothetical protein AB8H79_06185 [Myxococcota bacterium]
MVVDLPPWPTLLHTLPNAQDGEAFVHAVEALIGPCPQAELLEGWSPQDPVDVRIEVPNLTLIQAGELLGAFPTLKVVPGLLSGVQEARDQERVLPDRLQAGPITAVLWSDSVDGGLVLPDVTSESADAESAAVASELVQALRDVSVELVPKPGTAVDFVRDRTTGRRGWRLTVPASLLDPLDGESLHALRLDVLAALGQVMARRQTSDVRIAPDVQWDPRVGFSVLLWRSGPVGPALAGDGTVYPGLTPSMEALTALDLGDRIPTLELQVVPRAPLSHDDLVARVVARIEGTTLSGGRSRWVASQTGFGVPATWVFCPTWTLSAANLQEEMPIISSLAADDSVLSVRVVPGAPAGLEAKAPFLDPAVHWVGQRFVVRWRDGVSRRDQLAAWVPRDPIPADAPLVLALHDALSKVPMGAPIESDGRWVRPVVDDLGRCGFALHWAGAVAWDPTHLSWLFRGVGQAVLPGLSDVVDLALSDDAVVMLLWYRQRPGESAGDETWVSMG